MKEIKKVHAFMGGQTIDSSGMGYSYSKAELQQMADTFNPEIHEPPVVWGHENDNAWYRTTSSTEQLANGWITNVYVDSEDNHLYVDLKVDDDTYLAMKEERLKKRSIAFYPPDNQNNPNPGKWTVRHLALLGSEPPAIKGLKDIVLYSETNNNNMNKEQAIQALNENAAEWIALILSDDGAGFNQDIIELIPMPAQENNWLWDAEAQQYAGDLVDSEGKNYSFVISKSGDNWQTVVTPEASDGAEPTGEGDQEDEPSDQVQNMESENVMEYGGPDIEEEEGMNYNEKDCSCWDGYERKPGTEPCSKGSCVKKENKEYSELMEFKKAAEAELAQLREYREQQMAKERQNEVDKISTFCESMYDSGRLTESMMPKEFLVSMLVALLDSNNMTYSEGDNKVSVLNGMTKLLKALPKQVEFSEDVLSRQVNSPVIGVPRSYGNVSEESAKQYKAIKKYMEENNIATFVQARREYLASR